MPSKEKRQSWNLLLLHKDSYMIRCDKQNIEFDWLPFFASDKLRKNKRKSSTDTFQTLASPNTQLGEPGKRRYCFQENEPRLWFPHSRLSHFTVSETPANICPSKQHFYSMHTRPRGKRQWKPYQTKSLTLPYDPLQLYHDPNNCHRFFKCVNGTLTYETCENGLLFDPERATFGAVHNHCSYNWAVRCGEEK